MSKKPATASRFDNLSPAQLADRYGKADAIAKAAKAEMDDLKAELLARKIEEASGDAYSVSIAYDQISWRLDTEAVKAHLGAAYSRFQKISYSTIVRPKPNERLLSIADIAA
jgi:hypothetical protein